MRATQSLASDGTYNINMATNGALAVSSCSGCAIAIKQNYIDAHDADPFGHSASHPFAAATSAAGSRLHQRRRNNAFALINRQMCTKRPPNAKFVVDPSAIPMMRRPLRVNPFPT